MKKILKFLRKIYYCVINTCLLFKHKNSLVIYSCIVQNGDEIIKNNWGDDINFYLIKQLTGRIIVNYRQILFKNRCNFLCIGSIIEAYCNKNSIIWGSGAMHGNRKLKSKPSKVLAVRGKLTRQFLIGQGVDCPEVYGDPALLLPLVYKPNVEKKYKCGIIPHHTELNLPIISELEHKGYRIINLKKYNKWTDVIDEILECKTILSSSLHGLIVSDAYKTPNYWIRFGNINNGNDFKYYDYFSSVDRKDKLMQIESQQDIIKAENLVNGWTPINIDLTKLIDSCPFDFRI